MSKKDDEKKRDDPYALRDIFAEMEMDLVRSFQRNFIKHGVDEINAGFSWEMWQVAMLRNINEYHQQNKKIIGDYRPAVKDVIKNTLSHSYTNGKNNAEKQMEQAQIQLDAGSFSFPQDNKNVVEIGKTPPQEENFFRINEKKIDALIKSTIDDFEDVTHAVYRRMDDIYRQVIHGAEIQMTTGAYTLYEAIDKACEKFLTKGIDSIVYKNGAHVNIVSYAEMALRTASHRATLLGEGSVRDKYNQHLIFVSTHANSCRLCLTWQGQVLIDDVFSHPNDEYIKKYKTKFKLLSEAVKSGLLHPNCRHSVATWFESVSRLPKPVDDEIAIKNYEIEQKQRQLENAIRKAKRQYAGTCDPVNKAKAKKKLTELQAELRQHLKKYPEFKRNRWREKNHFNDVKLGNGSFVKGEFVEHIKSIKDVDKFIEKYENKIQDASVEHAYVIHGDGKVMRYIGNEKGVQIPVNGIENAIITHNHPVVSDIDSNCFGADDFRYLQQCGLQISRLRATYGNIRYEVKVLKDLSQLSFSEYRKRGSAFLDITADYIDMDENAYLLLAKEGYIEYIKTQAKVK
ncbi:MAG: capsid protein [Erysipelotrichaceae bacterium]|nr:capsid protein [Erysipelotrichaceae bacterium]